jgi:hypothetical protein
VTNRDGHTATLLRPPFSLHATLSDIAFWKVRVLKVVAFEHQHGDSATTGPCCELETLLIEGAPESVRTKRLGITIDVALQDEPGVIRVAEAQSKIERQAIRKKRDCLAHAHPGAGVENQTLDFFVS